MSTVEFAFDRLQSVQIREIEASGFVTSRLANVSGENEYKVTYWLDGSRKEDWFYEFELIEA